MKDESVLDSAGPVFIITMVLAVTVFATWVMLRGQGDWGATTPPADATTEVAGH
jgi:hypothetical protein